MSEVVVFDFDGVISNSIEECFLVSYHAYKGKTKVDSDFFEVDEPKTKPLFFQYRYLVGAAYEYFFLWEAIDQWLVTPDTSLISIYLQKKERGKTQETERHYEVFFQLRNQLRNKYLQDWIRINPVYPDIIELLTQVSNRFEFYIASTKDEPSIEMILKDNDFEMPTEHIVGKTVSTDKQNQLKQILQWTAKPPEKVYFIDDNLNHLNRVHPLDVHCFLASWGYNDETSRIKAQEQGIPVVDIDQWSKILENAWKIQ